jgi:hypothetical protein
MGFFHFLVYSTFDNADCSYGICMVLIIFEAVSIHLDKSPPKGPLVKLITVTFELLLVRFWRNQFMKKVHNDKKNQQKLMSKEKNVILCLVQGK